MQVHPNAKINIGLNITEKRTDGYHTIETVFYPIGLCDILDVEQSNTCSDYSFSSSGIEIDGEPENNLIIRVFKLLKNTYDIPPVDISLVKQIPLHQSYPIYYSPIDYQQAYAPAGFFL
jgi:4-diphosphocytidyl-2-C-methyl-D-erythritol kinase